MSNLLSTGQPNSPMVASPVSFHSTRSHMSTPAQRSTSSLPSLSQNNSPANILTSLLEFPAHAVAPCAESPKQEIVPLQRTRIPQESQVCPRKRHLAETFKSGGTPGVRVNDVLSDITTVDDYDEPVLTQASVRQIHLTLAVSPSFPPHSLRRMLRHLFDSAQWPGYTFDGKYITVQASVDGESKRKPITRGELAKRICKTLSDWMNRAVVSITSPHSPGRAAHARRTL